MKCLLYLILFCPLVVRAGIESQHYSWLPIVFNGPSFTVSEKQFLATANKSKNTFSFFNNLMQEHPDLQTTFTLVHKSQSLQRADVENPRVLFFTPNGLFFSFETFEKSNSFEVISFNQKSKKFDFKEIIFTNESVTIDSNPKKCFSCHAGQPIWKRYNNWPGVFGDKNDYFSHSSDTALKEEDVKLKELIEKKKNPYMRSLKLEHEDYFLFSEDKGYPFTPLRRNSYLLYHLGYYSLLTQYNGFDKDFTYNMNFLDKNEGGFGGNIPLQLAARTFTLGFEPKGFYDKVTAVGNDASYESLMIPEDKSKSYAEIFKNLKKYSYKSKRAPLAKCISCHSVDSNLDAPHIPFNNIKDFKKLVQSSDIVEKILKRISVSTEGSNLQMPPETPLKKNERESIIEFLNSI